jgi:hypothetical protein
MNAFLLGFIKRASHADERGEERASLSKDRLQGIQKAVDKWWYSSDRKKMADVNQFYCAIRNDIGGLAGYACLTKVGNPYNSRLVISTVLGPGMSPKGKDVTNEVYFN